MKYLLIFYTFFYFVTSSHAQTKFLQRGFGSAIASSQSNKMIGLHATYPKGTRLLVKNNATGSSVIIKIIGTLPNTVEHEKLIIRLSQAACKAIHATGKKFSVELYTVPPEGEEIPKPKIVVPKDSVMHEIKDEKTEMHHVAQGETLYSIAKKYKTTIEVLMQWNKLESTTLHKGQKLKIFTK